MNISKSIQNAVVNCDKDLLKDCSACKGCDEWHHFTYYDLVNYAKKERIWYCPKCIMIGNHVEFISNGIKMVCKRCNAVAEEITLEGK